jgi:pilus assembly protein Flp/PilA
MDEDVDRRVRRGGAEYIEAFIFARPIGDALRRPQNRPRPFARGDAARDDQRAVRRIDVLVVGVVERLLVHVAPDQRGSIGNGLRHFRPLFSITVFDESSNEAVKSATTRATYKYVVSTEEPIMTTLVMRFLADDRGATAIEYGLIAAGIAVAIIATVQALGTNLNTTFSTVSTSLK